jgi:hypothetical protein
MKDKRIFGMFGPRIKAMRLEQGLKNDLEYRGLLVP